MDDRPSWATTQPTTPLTYVPPPGPKPSPLLMVLLGGLIGIIVGFGLGIAVMGSMNQPSEHRTPPACIRALDLAAEGYERIGTGLRMASDSDLGDTSGLDAATTWLIDSKDEMAASASTCRASQ